MIAFNNINLPNHSKVWVYQSDRKLTFAEQEVILAKGKEFTDAWAAHGNELVAQLVVSLNYFIVLVLDENVEAASGCAIDKSMKLVLEWQKELKINFTNRLIAAVWIENEVKLYSYSEIRNALAIGVLLPSTLVFDNTIQSLNELKTNWLKPLKDTWLKKLLNPENVK